ncbi:MAG TPA: hypothetical protein VK886_07680 [Vicinamibacterales bacterium]|nr:hypothetical protein [Vicinamibacterales bacterium]
MLLLRFGGGCLSALVLVAASAAEAGIDRRVPPGGDLQQALNEARSGDRILLEPGATYVGNFVLPVRDGTEFIVVTTDPAAPDLPAPGTRVGPEHSGRLARIQSPNADPALRTAPRAHHWRLQLVEFQGASSSDVILLGDGGSAQRSAADVPYDLVIDRCYIHGDSALLTKRGIALNSARTTIVGSYISEIARPGQDSQAIAGWNGPGPFLIENNYLEAAAENFLLGGAVPAISGLVPSDVTFRRNHVRKPLAWRERKLNVKNLFELKNARRVLVEFNLFEYNWEAGQSGFAIVLTPRGERGRAPWATVEDVTFRYNVVRHTASAVNLLGRDDEGPSGQLRRLKIVHNLFYDVNDDRWGGAGMFLQVGDGPADIVVEHNTVLHTGTVVSAYGGSRSNPLPIVNFVYRDNLARHNRYGVHGASRAVGNDTLDVFFPAAVFIGNVLAGGKASLYPPDNFFPSVEEFEQQFMDTSDGNFQLKRDSSFRARASDGGDLGADVEKIRSGAPEEAKGRDRDRGPRRRVPGSPGAMAPAAVALVAGAALLARAARAF